MNTKFATCVELQKKCEIYLYQLQQISARQHCRTEEWKKHS